MSSRNDVYKEMSRTFGSDLSSLCRKLKSHWPTLNPEILMIYWLCHRNTLEPPTSASLTERYVERERSTPQKANAAKVGVDKGTPLPSLQQNGRPNSARGDQVAVSTPGTAWAVTSPDPLSCAELAKVENRCASTMSTADTVGTNVRSSPLGMTDSTCASPTPCVAPVVQKISNLVVGDSARHVVRSTNMKKKNVEIKDVLADKRRELRGAFLSNVPLLSTDVLGAEELHNLIPKLRPWNFKRGEYIITQGEIGDRLYIIERGACDAIRNGVVSGQMGRGAFFGEIAVIYDMPRMASIRAASDVTVLSLSRDDLYSTVQQEKIETIRTVARTRVFETIPLLRKLTPSQKVRIAHAMQSETWPMGYTLALEVHTTVRLYVIERGECRMKTSNKGILPSFMQKTWTPDGNVLGPGQFFGMRGLLAGAPMGFTICAMSNEVRTLSISYDEIVDSMKPEERDQAIEQMNWSQKAYLIRQIPELSGMSSATFKYVIDQVNEVHFKKWSVISAKGSIINAILILKCGKMVEHDGDASELRNFEQIESNCPERATPGDFFGEECLKDPSATTQTSRVALTDCTFLRVPTSVVWGVLDAERRYLSKIPLFSNDVLSMEEQSVLVAKLVAMTFAAGRDIITEGDIGDRLFIIERGICDAIKTMENQRTLGQLRAGAFFGEIAVVYDMPRTVTVRAATETTVLSLTRADLMSTVGHEKLDRMRIIARTQVFNSIPLLRGLDTKVTIKVAEAIRVETWQRGDVISHEAEPTRRLYIVERGVCKVVRGRENREGLPRWMTQHTTDTELHCGQYFGMTGLISNAPNCFSTSADSDMVKTLSISYQEILSVCGSEAATVARTLRENMRMHWLRQLPHIASLSDEQVRGYLNHIVELKCTASDLIYAVGNKIEGIYILENGAVVETSNGEISTCTEPGTKFPSCFFETSESTSVPLGSKAIPKGNITHATSALHAHTDCMVLRVPFLLMRPHAQHVGLQLHDEGFGVQRQGSMPMPSPESSKSPVSKRHLFQRGTTTFQGQTSLPF